MMFHHGQVDCIAGRKPIVSEDELFSSFRGGKIHWEYFVHRVEQRVERRLYVATAINGDVAMKNFLQHLRVSDEALPLADQPFQQTLAIGFMGTRRAHQIHRDVGIDQNHDCLGRYPCSISASIVSISEVGDS